MDRHWASRSHLQGGLAPLCPGGTRAAQRASARGYDRSRVGSRCSPKNATTWPTKASVPSPTCGLMSGTSYCHAQSGSHAIRQRPLRRLASCTMPSRRYGALTTATPATPTAGTAAHRQDHLSWRARRSKSGSGCHEIALRRDLKDWPIDSAAHLPVRDPGIHAAVTLLGWLREAHTSPPPLRLVLFDRVVEAACGWAGIQSTTRFVRDSLIPWWAYSRIRSTIESASFAVAWGGSTRNALRGGPLAPATSRQSRSSPNTWRGKHSPLVSRDGCSETT